VSVSSRVIALAVVGLLVAAGAAFAIGRASAGDADSSPDPAGAAEIEAPAGQVDTPKLQSVGAVPNLKEPPASSSGGATASPDTGTGSSPPTGTGVPSGTPDTSTPPPTDPDPVPPPPDSPAAPPPPPPGEG